MYLSCENITNIVWKNTEMSLKVYYSIIFDCLIINYHYKKIEGTL